MATGFGITPLRHGICPHNYAGCGCNREEHNAQRVCGQWEKLIVAVVFLLVSKTISLLSVKRPMLQLDWDFR